MFHACVPYTLCTGRHFKPAQSLLYVVATTLCDNSQVSTGFLTMYILIYMLVLEVESTMYIGIPFTCFFVIYKRILN